MIQKSRLCDTVWPVRNTELRSRAGNVREFHAMADGVEYLV